MIQLLVLNTYFLLSIGSMLSLIPILSRSRSHNAEADPGYQWRGGGGGGGGGGLTKRYMCVGLSY